MQGRAASFSCQKSFVLHLQHGRARRPAASHRAERSSPGQGREQTSSPSSGGCSRALAFIHGLQIGSRPLSRCGPWSTHVPRLLRGALGSQSSGITRELRSRCPAIPMALSAAWSPQSQKGIRKDEIPVLGTSLAAFLAGPEQLWALLGAWPGLQGLVVPESASAHREA